MRAVISTSLPSGVADLAVMARALVLAKGMPNEARAIAEKLEASDRVMRVLNKSSIGAQYTGDPNTPGLVDARVITTTFQAGLRNRSLFYTLLEAGMTRVPLNTRISFTTAKATAQVVGQGAAVPVTRIEVGGAGLRLRFAAGLIVVTDEMMRVSGSAGEALFGRELPRAVTSAIDEGFLSVVIDGDTPTLASQGPDAEDAVTDLKVLLAAVAPQAESRLMWAMAPDVGRAAAGLMTMGGGLLFPDMSPLGGEMLNLPAMVSDEIAAGELLLIDAVGIAGDSDLITVEASNEATIEMETAPMGDATTPTGTLQVSMFQTHSTALLAKAFFGCERLRDNAVAKITGVAWGGAVPVAS